MAITYPRTMPSEGAETQNFTLQRVDFGTADGAGRMASVTSGEPLWRLEINLGEMDADTADAWRAWLRSPRGAGKTFYARDLRRPYPKAYPAGFSGLNRHGGGGFPADGAPTSWSLNGTRDVLTLTGLPSTFAIKAGDLIGFVWSTTRRAMVAAIEDVTASGGVLAVTVEPPVPQAVSGSAAIKLAGVEAVMRLIPGEGGIGAESSVTTAGGQIVAIQDLRP